MNLAILKYVKTPTPAFLPPFASQLYKGQVTSAFRINSQRESRHSKIYRANLKAKFRIF